MAGRSGAGSAPSVTQCAGGRRRGPLEQQQRRRAHHAEAADAAVAEDGQPLGRRAQAEQAVAGIHEAVEVQAPGEQGEQHEQQHVDQAGAAARR